MVKNMKLPDGTIALVVPASISCDGAGCNARFEVDTVWPGQAVKLAREAGWISDFHFLWNTRSREYCPSCATDALAAHVKRNTPTLPPEPVLGRRYDRSAPLSPRW